MAFYAAVDGSNEEPGKEERLRRELADAEAALRAKLEPDAKKAGIPIEQFIQLVKLKELQPDQFHQLHRDVNRRLAEQEAARDRIKNAIRLLEKAIAAKSKEGESWELLDLRLKLKKLKEVQ